MTRPALTAAPVLMIGAAILEGAGLYVGLVIDSPACLVLFAAAVAVLIRLAWRYANQ